MSCRVDIALQNAMGRDSMQGLHHIVNSLKSTHVQLRWCFTYAVSSSAAYFLIFKFPSKFCVLLRKFSWL